MSKYSKTIASLIALAGAVGTALGDGHIDGLEWGAIAAAATAALAVYRVTNKPAGD